MPFTEEFIKIRNRFANQYSDKAKAETFAFEKAFKLSQMFCDKINVTHGIGTFITNNIPSVLGHKALNQVIKIVRANGRPVTKLSDDPLKAQCEDEAYLNYVKHAVK